MSLKILARTWGGVTSTFSRDTNEDALIPPTINDAFTPGFRSTMSSPKTLQSPTSPQCMTQFPSRSLQSHRGKVPQAGISKKAHRQGKRTRQVDGVVEELERDLNLGGQRGSA